MACYKLNFIRKVFYKKTIFKLFLLLALCSMITNCRKYPKRGQSLNKGEIIADYTGVNKSCIYFRNDECIVNSKIELDSIFSTCITKPDSIDFNSYSILGKTITGACDLKIIRELKIDHSAKQYIYSIKFKDGGICFKKGVDYNLVIVPKIPPEYSVQFNVHED
jgi:hypothetical protein